MKVLVGIIVAVMVLIGGYYYLQPTSYTAPSAPASEGETAQGSASNPPESLSGQTPSLQTSPVSSPSQPAQTPGPSKTPPVKNTPPTSTPIPPAPSPTQYATPPVTPLVAEIDFTANGFSPASLTVAKGTTVTFTNKDSQAHWPASGVHPIHQICAGLDPLQPLQPGESYDFTFNVAKTCPMHDHLNPGTQGTIIVQ